MNSETLQRKLQNLASLARTNGKSVGLLTRVLGRMDDWDLVRLNPVRLAHEEGIPATEMVDLFVLGAKVGLFDFVWNTICPHCGNVAFSCDSFDQVEEDAFFCMICHWSVPNTLDDEVETAFEINPSVKQVEINPFQDMASYCRYYFSPNFFLPPELAQYMEDMKIGYVSIPPDQGRDLTFDGLPGKSYRLISLDKHAVFFVGIKELNGGGPKTIDLDILPDGFSKRRVDLPPGRLTLKLNNLGPKATGALLVYTDLDSFYRVLVNYPAKPLPFLTGKMLLNNQTFRETFRMQNLRPDLKLNIRSLTVLFTDLKGSTELYDTQGDGVAYGLIQQHFKLLTQAVRRNSGAIVKTMGDAIMATFSTPEDGLRAALEMMEAMKGLNKELASEELKLGLKVGLHQGATLAVNTDERLDYFGQTVNIAARVQGLATAGEIRFTESVLPAAESVSVAPEDCCSVRLKGVGQETKVYCLRPA